MAHAHLVKDTRVERLRKEAVKSISNLIREKTRQQLDPFRKRFNRLKTNPERL